MPDDVLIIACGALAREIAAIRNTHGWRHVHLKCIDAALHNRPDRIPEAIRERLDRYRGSFSKIYVAYADCGTGGAIDRLLEAEGIERLPGAHCYQFFAGEAEFERLSAEEPGTFYLTDFLARNFERLIVRPLKLDTHPELRDAYFGNYRRLVYLSQAPTPALADSARQAADYLGLEFLEVPSGFGGLETGLRAAVESVHEENTHTLA